MRVLKVGVFGEDVRAWETFLRGLRPCSQIVVNQHFDDATREETKAFQEAVGFTGKDVDGIVGQMTYGKAKLLGFINDDDDLNDDVNWPPKPNNLSPLYGNSRTKVFGKFEYVPAPVKYNPEGIRIVDDWIEKNLVKVKIPQLIGVKGAPRSGEIYFHKKAKTQLVNMFQAWEDAGKKHLLLSWGGSWVPRYIRGSRKTLSNHSWATAFDINVPWNMLGAEPALVGEKGSVRELVTIANEHGFYWGGHYRSRKDGMHFEVAKVL